MSNSINRKWRIQHATRMRSSKFQDASARSFPNKLQITGIYKDVTSYNLKYSLLTLRNSVYIVVIFYWFIRLR
jgi:hypothetical protein